MFPPQFIMVFNFASVNLKNSCHTQIGLTRLDSTQENNNLVEAYFPWLQISSLRRKTGGWDWEAWMTICCTSSQGAAAVGMQADVR
jgi:hypothetical protein